MHDFLTSNLLSVGDKLQQELSSLNGVSLSVDELSALVALQENIRKDFLKVVEEQKKSFIKALSSDSLLNKSFYSSIPLQVMGSAEIGTVDEFLANLLLNADSIDIYGWSDFMDGPVAHYDELEVVSGTGLEDSFNDLFADKKNSANLYLVFIFAGDDYKNEIVHNMSYDIKRQYFIKV